MVTISFNNQTYTATYNEQSGYYECDLTAPNQGGVYPIVARYQNIPFEVDIQATKNIQVLAKEPISVHTNKTFIWVFNGKTFAVRGAVEIDNYEINIDEETNATSNIRVLKELGAKANDIIVIKKEAQVVYWGIIQEVQKDEEGISYIYNTRYITNIFDRFISLGDSSLIRTTGIEDFIADEIYKNFTNSTDTITNIDYLDVEVKTHTVRETSVTNINNNIYNLHTYMTNCTQNYDIMYNFDVSEENKLKMEIENKSITKELIDVNAQPISNYEEVFETDVVAKVIVKYNKKNDVENPGIYTLYLKTDRTTTTNMNDPDRADGKITTIFTENYEDANQAALDTMKSNSYNHNITFEYYDRYIPIGTPIAIKTKESSIYDTYISKITITNKKFYKYICGNIRVNFIDKLLKERN